MKLIIGLLFLVFLAGCRTEKDGDSSRNESANNRGASSDKENFYAFFYKFLSDENYRSAVVKDKGLLNKISLPQSDLTIHIYPSDSADFRDFEEDLSSKKVYSVISASNNQISNYNFIKENGKWFLNSIEAENLDISDDKKFIPFLLKFSKDTSYQKKHIQYPLKSSFLVSDNESGDTTVYLSANEVYALNFLVNDSLPFLHSGGILNEEYSSYTILFVGYGNEVYVECIFKFVNGKWLLAEEKDFST